MFGKIKGTGSYLPVQVWDNEQLSHMVDTSDEWIRGADRNPAAAYCCGEGNRIPDGSKSSRGSS